MPNPLDYLKRAGQWATTPLVSEEDSQLTQNAIDSPSLDRSPNMARLQGFGAGAMEGFGNMSSPMEIAGMASGGMGAMARGIGGAMRGLGGAMRGGGQMGQIGQMAQRAAPTMELLEDAPMVNQIAPGMDDVNSLIGDMRRNMARMPRRTQPPMETLGESAAEFTPRGGEGMYNAGRQASQAPQVGGMAQGQMSSRMGGRQR